MRGKINILFLIVGFLVIFIIGFYVGENSIVCKFCPPEDVDFSLLWEAWHKLEKNTLIQKNLIMKRWFMEQFLEWLNL